MSVPPPLSRKPYVAVLKWQALVTVGLAIASGLLAGVDGALSAVLGGVVNITAGVVYAVVVLASKPSTAGRALTTMLRAEGSKIVVILAQLWIVLATYKDVVLPAFLAAFVITVLLSSLALFVRD
jgi:ATP synthase protein I